MQGFLGDRALGLLFDSSQGFDLPSGDTADETVTSRVLPGLVLRVGELFPEA